MTILYVLRLANHKWYIGKSNAWLKRWEAHVSGNGPVWTQMHPPIDVAEVWTMTSKYDEQNKTIEYMGKYGIDNVRGGPFSTLTINYEERRIINRLFCDAEDLCFRCQSSMHKSHECYRGKRKRDDEILSSKFVVQASDSHENKKSSTSDEQPSGEETQEAPRKKRRLE